MGIITLSFKHNSGSKLLMLNIFYGLTLIWIVLVLHPLSYMSVLLWILTSRHGTDEARRNAKIKWILTKYEAWWLYIRASSGMCG